MADQIWHVGLWTHVPGRSRPAMTARKIAPWPVCRDALARQGVVLPETPPHGLTDFEIRPGAWVRAMPWRTGDATARTPALPPGTCGHCGERLDKRGLTKRCARAHAETPWPPSTSTTQRQRRTQP
jgi:hypothetical protein